MGENKVHLTALFWHARNGSRDRATIPSRSRVDEEKAFVKVMRVLHAL